MMLCRPNRIPYTWQARIIPGDDGFYHGPSNGSDEGQLAQGVMVDDDRDEAWATVAWLPDTPQTWWIGRFLFPPHDTYPPILGVGEIIFASDMDADLLLVETPARWTEIATGKHWPGPTACVLDWKRPDALRLWLPLVRGIQCETPRLERALRELLYAKPVRRALRIKAIEQAEALSCAA